MPSRDDNRLSRRGFSGAAAGALGALALGGPGAAQSATPETGASAWTYTDALGTETSLPQPPVRIAANLVTAAALWDLGIRAKAVFDSTASAYPDGDHIAWGNIDPGEVENIGDVDGNILPEKLIEIEPDVILTLTYENGNPDETAGVPPDFRDTFSEIAPVLVVTDMGPTDVQLRRLVDLAASLGADLALPEIVSAQEAYAAKADEFRTVAESRTDISTLFASFDADAMYVGGPGGVAELQYLESLGLVFANADSEAAGDFWETLSVEQALLYPADLVYSDVYSGFRTASELQDHSVYGALPAVVAGQVGVWQRDFPVSYAGLADFLESILASLRDAESITP